MLLSWHIGQRNWQRSMLIFLNYVLRSKRPVVLHWSFLIHLRISVRSTSSPLLSVSLARKLLLLPLVSLSLSLSLPFAFAPLSPFLPTSFLFLLMTTGGRRIFPVHFPVHFLSQHHLLHLQYPMVYSKILCSEFNMFTFDI